MKYAAILSPTEADEKFIITFCVVFIESCVIIPILASMREVAFIKQNKQKWLDFEEAIFGKSKKNPDEMASLYIHLVNDLSYAQTYYPKSKTVVYLNYLASQIYQKIYKTKREEKDRKSVV